MTQSIDARLGRHWLPIKAGIWSNLVARLRRFTRQLRCKHTHTFTAPIDGAYWESCGVRKNGQHKGLHLRGCYLCGQVWVEDRQA